MHKLPTEKLDAAELAVLEEIRAAERQYKLRELIEHLARIRGIEPEILRDAVWQLTDQRRLMFDRDWHLSTVNELNAHNR